MTWTAYRVVFKLKSPLHIGCGKVGNVQLTRSYVTGRVFWGALTMRLTRDLCKQESKPATHSEDYQKIGEVVNEQLAYTYFYLTKNEDYSINEKEEEWPWQKESQFRRRFLSSYASTALVYPQQVADEGLLHEVEFISPRTLDHGKQVCLVGYVFEREGCEIQWKFACKRLQIGGERGYGWGDVQYVEVKQIVDTKQLFNTNYSWQKQNGSIVIQTSENNSRLLSHTKTTENLSVQGEIEPLVGREWRSQDSKNPYSGQYVEKFCDPCWIPGSKVKQPSAFVIQKFGIWQVKD